MMIYAHKTNWNLHSSHWLSYKPESTLDIFHSCISIQIWKGPIIFERQGIDVPWSFIRSERDKAACALVNILQNKKTNVLAGLWQTLRDLETWRGFCTHVLRFQQKYTNVLTRISLLFCIFDRAKWGEIQMNNCLRCMFRIDLSYNRRKNTCCFYARDYDVRIGRYYTIKIWT